MDTDCVVCMNKMNIDNRKILGCTHEICTSCYTKWRGTCRRDGVDVTCPCCRYVVEKDMEREIDYAVVIGYQEFERIIYEQQESDMVGLELADVGGNPVWRELLQAQFYNDPEIYDENDELVDYGERDDHSDSDESFIDYPDDDECDW